jgi:hypothetical protein
LQDDAGNFFVYAYSSSSEEKQSDSERRAGDVWLKRKAWSVKKYFLPYRCFSWESLLFERSEF